MIFCSGSWNDWMSYSIIIIKKKIKVLIIEKNNLVNNDTRTLAVNASSRDFLKELNLWNEIKQIQPIKNIYIRDYVNSEELVFENKKERYGDSNIQ